ncbi:hypothetical protein [Mycobacteroides chelonae]|jgi:hypothetical protein|uniref:hypothetical protein n=1 Tax=Mycobacteroides chelonae TaxID=1774 RepID=UPI000A5CE1D6|nr:hypothetical protein [Mycobacteroides chelonae]MBV6359996.1 hypothetical protein [Mycobacteroides chelonae]MEC4834400.1 hypothetical protein [Mycobacteroides chelonae]MEC4856680.1 hypothetical protein [Mycobacteroides chelonae]MEC4873102.1 hypothetical protein [Mycobacteroides chelonae]MEC4901621.1 hypothetical protein [Mycobacteroides chelonae]
MNARYGVREVFNGRFRIVKRFGNEDFAERGSYATRELAEGRMAQLEQRAARSEAVAHAKRRAKNHCECKGECGHLHFASRTCLWGEGEDIGGGLGKVVLTALPIDGDDNNLALSNIRMVCQLCKQHHDADRINGGAALFDIKEPG